MQRFGIRHLGAMLSLVLVFGLLAAGIGVVRAQDDDVTVDGPGTPRPGHIHAGSCLELGDVVFPFNNATIDNLDEDYESTGDVDFAGAETANPVYVSETTLEDVTLDDILAADHTINFHLSTDDLATYIACGDIGGFARDGELYVGLLPDPNFPETPFAGSALLTDNGDDTVTVVVRLVELPTGATGTGTTGTTAPAATPAVSTPIVTVPDESVAPSADASVEESEAPSADASVEESVEPSADASVEESAAPSEDGAPSDIAAPSADESVDGAPSDIAAPSDDAAPVASEEPEA